MTSISSIAKTFLLIFIMINLSCYPPDSLINQAEEIYINGNIVTMDESKSKAEAFAVGNGKIMGVGSTELIKKAFPAAVVIDLGGKTVMPGIIESHGHLLTLGQSFVELNLEGLETPEECIELVRAKVRETPAGEWIIGWGWDDGAWAVDYPDNEQLSRISPDNPVYLRGLHGFASWVNKKAIETAGIDRNTQEPDNGKIMKDPVTGGLTGILTDNAQVFVEDHIPPMNREQCERALKFAIDECLKYGLTTIHEARTTTLMLEALRSLKAKNELKARIYTMIDVEEPELIETFMQSGPEIDPDNMLINRCVKVFVDGALGSRGALMIEPYSDAQDVKGVVTHNEEELYRITKRSLQEGFQVATHAIGDLANRITLNAYKRAISDVPEAEDHRLRLEHAQVTAIEDMPKFAPLNIVLSMQPPHATSDMPWAEIRVGPERIKGAYAWRSFLDTGVHFTLNSDFPGETLDPFRGMYFAETRQTVNGEPEGGWYPEQCLTRDEVLKAYTIEAAYSGFEEEIKGRIMPGMLADFIVISGDITSISSEELLRIKVEKTFLGGKEIFRRQ
ncbi:MAG: amidohydrolase [bacterium]|nr:amidohydrolase [bacterium]